MASLNVLSLSTAFPNPADEISGTFVQRRLQKLAEFLNVQVVAPIALVDYAARRVRRPGIPKAREDKRLRIYHPRWFYLPFGGYTAAFCLAARLAPFVGRIRREYPFDVIDSHFAYPAGITAALLGAAFDVPFAITLRGSETVHVQSPGAARWIRWALQRAARVIAVSERLRSFAIANGVDEKRVRTIPNGVDADVFHPRPHAEARLSLGIPGDCRMILSAGFLTRNKGHHRVVRALGELRRNGSKAELWIVGGPGREPSYENEIRTVVRQRGLESAVHFIGSVAPAVLSEFYSAADVFCLASAREGWPNVVHEAQACGAPIVATDVGAVRDMLPSREYGIAVPAGEDAALATALGDALESRWDRAAIATWGRARSWSQVALETAEVLTEAAAEKRPEKKISGSSSPL
jgi:teichuronic acid biosynthesis glycosyltransferase TuaC